MQDARFKVLTLLEIREKATARELAELVGARREAVGMLLVRSRRDGLVQYNCRSGRHRLSDRGRARLAWLRGRQP